MTTASREVLFTVAGVPRPKGSFRAIPLRRKGGGWACNPKTGAPLFAIVDDSKGLKEWARTVRKAARVAMVGRKPLDGPVAVWLQFVMPRPQNHLRTGKRAGELKDWAPTWSISEPDLDKLRRAIFDALSEIVYGDDRQVAADGGIKRWARPGERPGVGIAVEELKENDSFARSIISIWEVKT